MICWLGLLVWDFSEVFLTEYFCEKKKKKNNLLPQNLYNKFHSFYLLLTQYLYIIQKYYLYRNIYSQLHFNLTIFKINEVNYIQSTKPVNRFALFVCGHNLQFYSSRNILLQLPIQLPQLCLPLCDPMYSSLPHSFAHGIFQANILKWNAMPFSRGSSQPRNQTHISWVSCIAGRFVTL